MTYLPGNAAENDQKVEIDVSADLDRFDLSDPVDVAQLFVTDRLVGPHKGNTQHLVIAQTNSSHVHITINRVLRINIDHKR